MRARRSLALLLLACGCTGRTVDAGPPDSSGLSGDVTIEWTVNGSTHPLECRAVLADFTRITIVTGGGVDAGAFVEACDAFTRRITLEAGGYTATAVLVDAAGRALTVPVSTDPFVIEGDDDLVIELDILATSQPQ